MENKQTGVFPFIRAVTDFVFVSDAPEKVDVILIPGSRHPANAIRAAELYCAGYAPYVLPSGRHGAAVDKFIGVMPEDRAAYPDDYPTEWAFLRDVLIKHGVPDSAILREDEATFTWDNARKSAAVLKAQGISARTAILCCRPFHARRRCCIIRRPCRKRAFWSAPRGGRRESGRLVLDASRANPCDGRGAALGRPDCAAI